MTRPWCVLRVIHAKLKDVVPGSEEHVSAQCEGEAGAVSHAEIGDGFGRRRGVKRSRDGVEKATHRTFAPDDHKAFDELDLLIAQLGKTARANSEEFESLPSPALRRVAQESEQQLQATVQASSMQLVRCEH